MVAVTKDAVTGTVTPRHSAVEVLRYAAAVQPSQPPGPASRAVHADSGGREDPAPGHRSGQEASAPVVAVGGKAGHLSAGHPSGASSVDSRRDRKGRISLDDLFKQANRLSQLHKPHKANDAGWEAVEKVRARDGELGLNHFKLLKRLGCGDIGSVYLAELRDTKFRFAMKVMDLGSLASRRKQMRAETERDILSILDHPFLPTLYAHFETPQFLCLVMEYCAGGDLHTLRQKQDGRFFSCKAARFYAAEVLLGLEYLHMMGVVYRDLKPENVLVRGDGHVMLSDFDLSLKCSVSPTLLTQGSINHSRSSNTMRSRGGDAGASVGCRDETKDDAGSCYNPVSCLPRRGGGSGMSWWEAACITSRQSSNSKNNGLTSQWPAAALETKVPSSRWRTGRLKKTVSLDQVVPLPQLVAEPMGVRSMSFVGTHEYLAPEIISGDGHGSPVDWWTFGIFLFELLYGKTPFKGEENEITLVNVLAQPLEFPPKGDPYHREIDSSAQELIKALLVKDPQKRLGSNRGATEVKRHPFFEGINWALIRCTLPPQIPRPPGQTPKMKQKQQQDHLRDFPSTPVAAAAAAASKPHQQSDSTPPPTPTPPRGVHQQQQHKTKNYDMVGDSRDRSTSRFEYF